MLNKVILAQGSHTPKCHQGEALLMLNKVVKPRMVAHAPFGAAFSTIGSLTAFVHLLVQHFSKTREW